MNMTIERPFKIKSPEDKLVKLLVEPGRVSLPDALSNLSWHDAERLSVHLKEAAAAARVLQDIRDQQVVDVRLVCTQCSEQFREGVVTMQDPEYPEGDRRRHVVGSPECGR